MNTEARKARIDALMIDIEKDVAKRMYDEKILNYLNKIEMSISRIEDMLKKERMKNNG